MMGTVAKAQGTEQPKKDGTWPAQNTFCGLGKDFILI